MENTSQTRTFIQNFIENIWNKEQFDSIDDYLHIQYIDHSLAPTFSTDKSGLMQWITATGKSFEHRTLIEEQVVENDTAIIKIKMELKHIGVWREITPTGKSIATIGYRCFKMKDNKIIAHWALIDGNSIESQLKECSHGCKIQQ